MKISKRVVKQVQASVRRGAKLLDKRRDGWFKRRRVSIVRLDMESALDCVLGQLEGRYSTGIKQLYKEERGEKAFCEDYLSWHGAFAFGREHGFALDVDKHYPYPGPLISEKDPRKKKVDEWFEKKQEMLRVQSAEWADQIRQRRESITK